MRFHGKRHLAFCLVLCLLLLMMSVGVFASSADATPTFTELKLDMVGRLFKNQNRIEVSVSADGTEFAAAGVIEKIVDAAGNDVSGRGQTLKLDLTDAVKDLTAETVYVKLNLYGDVEDRCAIQTLNISGKVDGESHELVKIDYTAMTQDSDEYQADMHSYQNVKLANVTTGGTTDVTLQPLYKNSSTCYVVFAVTAPEASQPEPPAADGQAFETLKLDMVGRLFKNQNRIEVSVSADGTEFAAAGVIEKIVDASGNDVSGRGQTLKLDLTDAVKNIAAKTVYVKLNLYGDVEDRCAIQTLNISGKVGGESHELVKIDYTAMTQDSDEYQADMHSYQNVKLANVTTGGTTDVTLQPAYKNSSTCYVVFAVTAPDVTQPEPPAEDEQDPPASALGNTVSVGYTANYENMDAASTDWQADVYDTSAMKVFFDKGDSITMFCPDEAAGTDKTGYVTYKVTADEGASLGLLSVHMVGRVFNKDVSTEDFYLKVEYSVDDGATWENARTFTSVHTTGKKNQNYIAVLGNIEQSAVLVRVTMRSDYQDWVGLRSLKIAPPAMVKPGFSENFGAMRPGATSYQQNALNFNLTSVYASNDGYTSLTTDMSSTTKGRSTIDYLIVAEEGKTLDGLTVDMIGRLFDKTGDVNRGITFYYSDDYGSTFTEYDRIQAGAVTSYGQDMWMDLSEIAAGKTDMVVRLEINSKYWDWVSIELLQFTVAAEDDEIPGEGDDDGDDNNAGTQQPGNGDDGNGDNDKNDGEDGNDSPATGYAATSAWVVALSAALLLLSSRQRKRA